MKKIAFWTPYMGNIGTIKATIHSASALKKFDENLDITLFKIYSEWEGYEEEIKSKNIHITDFELKKRFKKLPKYGFMYRISMLLIMFYSTPKLIKYFNEEKPDVIFAYLQGVTPIIARIFAKHKPKIILSIQGLPDFLASNEVYKEYPLYKKLESKLRIFIWKKLYSKADYIIALTEKTKNSLKQFLNTENIIYIPNPIIDKEEIINNSNEKIEENLFLEGEYILAIGRLTKQKDFVTLIKSFKIVNQSFKNLKLIILGEGEERENLTILIKNLDLENKVILYGFVSNPYKYLKNAKLFVLSSLWEDPGHVLMESAFLKIPIVATNCPNDVDKFLMYGKAGYLCEIGNEKDMADKIIQALQNNNKEKIELAYKQSLNFTEENFYNNTRDIF